MVKAVRVHEFGGPEVMRLEEIELPQPGKNQVLVRNHAAGVNYIDTYFRTGAYKPPSLPFTPGNEAAGEIVALGKGVKDFREGDRVAYVDALGCYAQERIVAADRLIKLTKDDRLRDGRGHDAEGPYRAISSAPDVQGRRG